MEGEGRGFTEISVSVCGAQSGKERFSAKEDKEPPKFCRWRNNLTTLSQRHNLYFVAYLDEIYVYRPLFPTQALPSRPDLILRLPASQPSLSGYIDLRHPHAVNNLLVGDLGEEEIVACVCDDGDVLAYHTRAVFHTVERRSAGDGLGYDDGDMIKPFFNDNVGLSAWGLAIHKASRMIAVSANTHEITVFAFALSSKDLNIDPASSVDDVSRHAVSRSDTSDCLHQRKISPSQRAENVRISLEGHRDNIPNIAFCNTDDDKEGRWLFSADIDGEMLVWDIWSRKGLRRHTFARPPISPGSPAVFLNRIGRGWGVICLDTRAFRLTQGPQETFGCVPECRKGIWDISGSRADVRDASIWHAGFSRFTAVRETHNGAQPSANSDDAASLDDSEGTDGDIDEPDWFIDTDEEDHEDGSESNTVLVDDDSESGTPSLAEQQMIYESMTSVSLNHNDVIQEIGGSDHGAAQFGTSPPCRPSGKVWPERTETCVATPDKLSEPRLPRCAIIYTSETDIRFLQDPMKGPTVAFQQPLTQNLPPNLQWLDRFDRLNILAQIPELGIVAVATQTGRIALLTLTRMTMTKHLAFRLDTILPLRSQEDEGRRPDVPLLGLAIGPIQGREMTLASIESDGLKSDDRRESWRGVESSRRYRLMLTYYDHTVLSYEIGRPSTAASSTEDELLVL